MNIDHLVQAVAFLSRDDGAILAENTRLNQLLTPGDALHIRSLIETNAKFGRAKEVRYAHLTIPVVNRNGEISGVSQVAGIQTISTCRSIIVIVSQGAVAFATVQFARQLAITVSNDERRG